MDWKLFGVTNMLICIIKNVQLIVCQLSFNKAVKILPGNIHIHKYKLMPVNCNNKLNNQIVTLLRRQNLAL